MWVAKFKLLEEEGLLYKLCAKNKVVYDAMPFTNYTKGSKIHLFSGGIVIGTPDAKKKFIRDLKESEVVHDVQMHRDFILIHSIRPKNIKWSKMIDAFYDPQFIKVRPIRVDSNGQVWEIASPDRTALNNLVQFAIKNVNGKLLYLKKKKIKSVWSMSFAPDLTHKQFESLQTAFKLGYYEYPRETTLTKCAKDRGIAFSTFQEHLSRAEAKLITFFFRYR